jgi:hypothetical protein
MFRKVKGSVARTASRFHTKRSSWFLDQNYVDNVMDMCRKVNARKKIIGWCSAGPSVPPMDIGIPTEAYISVEEPREDGDVDRTFEHFPRAINSAISDPRQRSKNNQNQLAGFKDAAFLTFKAIFIITPECSMVWKVHANLR